MKHSPTRLPSMIFVVIPVLAIAPGLQAMGAAPAPAPAAACPGAESWNRAHVTPAQPARPAAKDPALLAELRARVDRDQAARRQWLADPRNETLAQAVDAVDATTVTWLRDLVGTQGFPTVSKTGDEGPHLAWILLQHADRDPELQRRLLPVLEARFSAGELPANDLARMTDRILLAGWKPQIFGTQFDWFSGSFQLPDAARLAEIDGERARIGLMPLSDYVCTIRKQRENVVAPARNR